MCAQNVTGYRQNPSSMTEHADCPQKGYGETTHGGLPAETCGGLGKHVLCNVEAREVVETRQMVFSCLYRHLMIHTHDQRRNRDGGVSSVSPPAW